MVQFKKIEVVGLNHATGDTRKATAYTVSIGGEGVGTVYTKSSESWLQTSNGVRYYFSGYSRSWSATTPDGQEFRYNRTRAEAAEKLAQYRQGGGK